MAETGNFPVHPQADGQIRQGQLIDRIAGYDISRASQEPSGSRIISVKKSGEQDTLLQVGSVLSDGDTPLYWADWQRERSAAPLAHFLRRADRLLSYHAIKDAANTPEPRANVLVHGSEGTIYYNNVRPLKPSDLTEGTLVSNATVAHHNWNPYNRPVPTTSSELAALQGSMFGEDLDKVERIDLSDGPNALQITRIGLSWSPRRTSIAFNPQLFPNQSELLASVDDFYGSNTPEVPVPVFDRALNVIMKTTPNVSTQTS